MAMLNFDATQVQPDEGQLDPIPTDWYNLIVDQSEIKPTKENNGNYYLSIRLSVVDGKFANRKIFERFNIKNSNPTAQEIAYKQLSALAHAVGVLDVKDSQQLHNIPFRGRVKLVPAVYEADGQTVKYAPKNEMGAYRSINDQSANNPNAAQAQQGNPFAGQAQMPQPQGNPFGAMSHTPQHQASVQQAQPQQQWQPPAQGTQPWMQGQAAPAQQQAATVQQQQPAPQTQSPQQNPADWAQQAAPTPQQQAPVQHNVQPASPPVDQAAVQAAQSNIPPWMKQPA